MQAFLEAISTFVDLLRDVDRSLGRQTSIRWRLATLRYSSPAVVGCVGEPRKPNQPDMTPLVVRTVLAGFEELEEGRRPKGFSDDALESAKRLADLRGQRGVHDVTILDPGSEDPQKGIHVISRRVSVTVDELIGAKFESMGSVDGRLEVVSSHGGNLTCNVYEMVTGKPVKCTVPREKKAVVLEYFDSMVRAFGTIWRDSSGYPRRIDVESIEPLETRLTVAPLPELGDKITGGLDIAEYLKRQWE